LGQEKGHTDEHIRCSIDSRQPCRWEGPRLRQGHVSTYPEPESVHTSSSSSSSQLCSFGYQGGDVARPDPVVLCPVCFKEVLAALGREVEVGLCTGGTLTVNVKVRTFRLKHVEVVTCMRTSRGPSTLACTTCGQISDNSHQMAITGREWASRLSYRLPTGIPSTHQSTCAFACLWSICLDLDDRFG
jgi:hypothetical protein